MAAAISTKATVRSHNEQTVYAEVTFDASYPTGGEAVVASDFGLHGITHVIVTQSNVATKRAYWEPTTGNILVYVEDGTTGIEAQAANTSDQSALQVGVIVIGV